MTDPTPRAGDRFLHQHGRIWIVFERSADGRDIWIANVDTKPDADLLATGRGELTRLRAAAEAGLRYDAAIQKRVVDGAVDIIGTGGGVAQGDDLDALYEDWIAKCRAALAGRPGGGLGETMKAPLNTQADLLRQLLHRNASGVWFVRVDDRLAVLPRWLWAYCEKIAGKIVAAGGEGP